MTGPPPTVTNHIAAVEAAARHYLSMAEKSIEHGDELRPSCCAGGCGGDAQNWIPADAEMNLAWTGRLTKPRPGLNSRVIRPHLGQ